MPNAAPHLTDTLRDLYQMSTGGSPRLAVLRRASQGLAESPGEELSVVQRKDFASYVGEWRFEPIVLEGIYTAVHVRDLPANLPANKVPNTALHTLERRSFEVELTPFRLSMTALDVVLHDDMRVVFDLEAAIQQATQ